MRRGVTLIEILIALAIGAVVLVAMVGIVRAMLNLSMSTPQAISAVDEARSVAGDFTNEIRDATQGSDGSYPLVEASTSEIIFFTPFSTGGPVERVRYFASSTTLYKGTTLANASNVYDISKEKVTPVLHALIFASTPPLFAYYDGSYNGSTTPLAQPVNLNVVTYAAISLTLLEQGTRYSTSTFTITAGSTLRNLKTNLGN